MNKPVISCTQLSKSYDDGTSKIEVLRDINLSVHQSEMIAIVGASGSGKSTLLHLLGGLDKPTYGNVMLNGYQINELSEKERCHLRNKSLGFVYQFHYLLPEFSALENVSMPLLIRNSETLVVRDKAAYLLEQVGLQDRLHHRLSELSGGERQRVAIARALVGDPSCVLADEPTGNLDNRNADRVLSLFFELQKTHQTGVVMVTHDVAIAKQAQRVMKIEDGRLVDVTNF